jgi:methionine-rich copper-binding protein CopC
VAVIVVAGALALGFGAGPAAAHAVLEKTSPADGSTVSAAPASVSLTFDEAPQTKFSAVHVTGPDGQRKDNGPITVANAVLTEQLGGSRPAGRYVVDWRVISDDGHPVSGQFSFTARAAASTVAVENGGKGPAAKSTNNTGVIVGVAAAVVVFAGLLAFLLRRKRGPGPAAHE